MLTDGDDTASKRGQGDVLDRATADEVMIYGIGLESDYFDGVRQVRTNPDRVVRRLADETGGGYYLLKETSDLNTTFTRIAQELHSQYVLGFTPAALDGKIHKLTVNVKRPGMKARARKSYVATSEAAPGTAEVAAPARRPRGKPARRLAYNRARDDRHGEQQGDQPVRVTREVPART